MKSEDKEKTVQAILQMLNGLNYVDAKEILDAAHERVLDALKITLPEAEQPPQDNSTIERLIESNEFHEAVLKIAKDEDDRRGWALLESTCPPEFVKALRQESLCPQCDSSE